MDSEFQKQRMNSKKLMLAIMNPCSNKWSRNILFIRSVTQHLVDNPSERCVIACANKKYTESLLDEYGIDKTKCELVVFPKQESHLYAILDEMVE